jgi:hypothetical protein
VTGFHARTDQEWVRSLGRCLDEFFFIFMAVGIAEKRRQRAPSVTPAVIPAALSCQP